MDRNSVVSITEIFTDAMFEAGCVMGGNGYDLFPIARPDGRIKPTIIQKLVATRNNNPLYWINNEKIPSLPSMDASEVEREVIKDIIECLVWETIK
jgi:hypothetical protein